MPAQAIKTIRLPDVVYRVAIKDKGLGYSCISPEDDADPTAGHRFDVLGAGVLYAATRLRACFLETLGVLRPSTGVILEAADDDGAFMDRGAIPHQWHEDRSMFDLVTARDTDLVFVDLTDVQTRTTLAGILSERLARIGIKYLDVPDVTSKNRAITRLLARTIYSVRDDDKLMFGGIRYCSRYDPSEECWAIFDRYPIEIEQQRRISCDDDTLLHAATDFGLVIHR